jgi:hypothetical protein
MVIPSDCEQTVPVRLSKTRLCNVISDSEPFPGGGPVSRLPGPVGELVPGHQGVRVFLAPYTSTFTYYDYLHLLRR